MNRVAAMALAGLLAAGCGAASKPAPPGQQGWQARAVPWVNRPAPVFVPPSPPMRVAAYPPCHASQLAGTAGRNGPAAGTVFQEVRLTDTSDRSCTLSGEPTAVAGLEAAGGVVTLTRAATGGSVSLAGLGPVNLRPGQSGWVTLSYADGCPAITSGGKAMYQTLFIEMGDGQVRVRFPFALNLVCGLGESMFGAPLPAPPSSRSPLNVLAATVRISGTLRVGAAARYTVTLHNRSGEAVRLVPCPSYVEFLGVYSPRAKPALTRYYYLNCGAVSRIAAHRSVTFEMLMAPPAGTGQAKVDWQLQDSNVADAVIVTISG